MERYKSRQVAEKFHCQLKANTRLLKPYREVFRKYRPAIRQENHIPSTIKSFLFISAPIAETLLYGLDREVDVMAGGDTLLASWNVI